MEFHNLDPGITFKQLADKIIKEELSNQFTYDWFNDDHYTQKIEGAYEVIGDQLIPSNQKVEELLPPGKFFDGCNIYLKHRTAGCDNSKYLTDF